MFEVRLNSPGDDTPITLAVVRMGSSSSESVRESSAMRKAVTLKIDPTQIDGACCKADGSGEHIAVSVVVVVAQAGSNSNGNNMEGRRVTSGMGRFRLNVECANVCGESTGFGSAVLGFIDDLAGSNGQQQQSGHVMLTQQGCPVCVG